MIFEIQHVLMNTNGDCKNVFVENETQELLGWVTDTLILRYMDEKKVKA